VHDTIVWVIDQQRGVVLYSRLLPYLVVVKCVGELDLD